MMRPLVAWLAVLTSAVVVPTASAEPLPYRGPHPLDLEGSWHEEQSVHVHDELPVGTAPFGSVDGVMVFLGDPVAYGWDGDVWTYGGVHPLPARIGEYCGIDDEHRHPFAPEGSFREEEGVYRFVGALRGGVPQHRPGRVAPAGGAVRPPRDQTARPYYLHAPVCGVVTERVGDTTTTFVSGYPGCLRRAPAAGHRHVRPGADRDARRPHRHVRRPHRDVARRHRDGRRGRSEAGTERERGADMRSERRDSEPRGGRPQRSVPPAARRGR